MELHHKQCEPRALELASGIVIIHSFIGIAIVLFENYSLGPRSSFRGTQWREWIHGAYEKHDSNTLPYVVVRYSSIDHR